MQIWVDADACPRAIKEILYRAAERTRTPMILVANKLLWVPPSPFIRAMKVPHGFNVADRQIVDQVGVGDLVVTADIPLAAEVIARGGLALDPRGTLYSEDNIEGRLALRNFMDEQRGSGVETPGPAPFRPSDTQAFANQLTRLLPTTPRPDTGGG